jgi:hypothetical protein
MSQFYVPDEDSAQACGESLTRQVAVTVSGVDVIDNNVKLYTGMVQSVEDNGPQSPRIAVGGSRCGAADQLAVSVE